MLVSFDWLDTGDGDSDWRGDEDDEDDAADTDTALFVSVEQSRRWEHQLADWRGKQKHTRCSRPLY